MYALRTEFATCVIKSKNDIYWMKFAGKELPQRGNEDIS